MRWPDDLTEAPGAVRPLATREALLAHLGLPAGTDGDVLDQTLATATAMIEGWTSRTKRWFRAVDLTITYRGGATPLDPLILPCRPGAPDDVTATARLADGTSQALPFHVLPRNDQWQLVAAGPWPNLPLAVEVAYQTPDAPIPAPVVTAALKLAAQLYQDRSAPTMKEPGEGIDWREIDLLLAAA